MEKYIIIEADTNDGDYVTKVSEITDEQIELIKPVIEAILKNDKLYETEQLIDEHNAEELYGHLEGFETFAKFVPHGDPNYLGVHTIESVMIVSKIEKLI